MCDVKWIRQICFIFLSNHCKDSAFTIYFQAKAKFKERGLSGFDTEICRHCSAIFPKPATCSMRKNGLDSLLCDHAKQPADVEARSAVTDRRNGSTLLSNILKVDLKSDLFSYAVDEAALAQAQLMDGKLMLVTNVADLTPAEIVQRYKALADIERGFRVLKSEKEIAPVYHRLPDRIRAHAQICFMALIVYRVMRQRLKQAKSDLSPERALAHLRKIQRHKVRINQAEPMEGVSTISDAQAQVFNALKVNKPIKNEQLSLL